ncbi:MAG: SDR family oxidoreductase, partial [Gammaproteobacteria bacterium]
MDIAGKHIVITGAASGIGRAMAQRFHAEGAAKLFLVDLNEAPLKEVAEPLGADYCVCNVGLEHDVLGTIKRAEAALGHIDLLCNNAGISVRGGPEVDTADWQRIWEINVMAHVWASRAALPAMLERGDGYILNTASAAGLLSQIGSAPYAVTKHAAVSFAEWLSITYGDRGIKVSVLCPQAVRTAMIAGNEDGVASVDGLMEPEALCDTVI